MMGSTMNLISGTHNLCEKMEYAFIVLREYTIIFPNHMAKVCRNVKIFYVIQNKLVSCQEKRTVWTIIWYIYYLDKFDLDVIYICLGPNEKILAAFGTLFLFWTKHIENSSYVKSQSIQEELKIWWQPLYQQVHDYMYMINGLNWNTLNPKLRLMLNINGLMIWNLNSSRRDLRGLSKGFFYI